MRYLRFSGVGVIVAGLALLGTSAGLARGAEAARTFYVDDRAGRDDVDGRSADRAWRTLDRVNTAELRPGDTVRFRCGGEWRGSLVPVSGSAVAPVTYTSFGRGAKPLLLGSVPRHQPTDWVKVRDNLWATLPVEYRRGKQLLDLRKSEWTVHQEGGAQVERRLSTDRDGVTVRLVSRQAGSAANHVQLWGPGAPVDTGGYLLFTFQARSSKPLRLPAVELMRRAKPWTRLALSAAPDRPLGDDWATFELPLRATQTAADGALHLSLGGLLAADTTLEIRPISLHAATPTVLDPLTVDVGNVIFDDGAVCGWKKWSLKDLTRPYDYFYDRATQRVFLHSPVVPTERHRRIELALTRHVVNQGGRHHVVYDGLAVLYGAAHGFGGGDTHHLTIRNCDVGYIGGGHQHDRPDGTPVRYGNGIEFWAAAHDNLVEGCRLWQVYDAALTNQGTGPTSRQVNITYRNNFIRDCEYSFEYWNNPESAVTRDVRFENNTCVRAGRGWGHAQRPDPNGSHLMFYRNTAATSGLVIRYNVFHDVTDWGCRYDSGWRQLPDLDGNLWSGDSGVAAWWFGRKIRGFDAYRQASGLDAHSRHADPGFVDPAAGDYRLRADSPARRLRPDGGPVGAEFLFTPKP